MLSILLQKKQNGIVVDIIVCFYSVISVKFTILIWLHRYVSLTKYQKLILDTYGIMVAKMWPRNEQKSTDLPHLASRVNANCILYSLLPQLWSERTEQTPVTLSPRFKWVKIINGWIDVLGKSKHKQEQVTCAKMVAGYFSFKPTLHLSSAMLSIVMLPRRDCRDDTWTRSSLPSYLLKPC